MVVIAEKYLARRYEARAWSLGALLHVTSYIALLILPFVIAYSSQSFWVTERIGREQPEVHFAHEVLVLAQASGASQQLAFSTTPALNALFGDAMRPASVRLREEDTNQDGRPELLHISISLPLQAGEEVTGVTVLVALQYSLQRLTRFSTNATAILTHAAAGAGAALQAWGELELRTSKPLSSLPALDGGGPPVLAGAGAQTTLSGLSPAALISNYMSFATAVHLEPRYPVWVPGGGNPRFVANVTIAVRPAAVLYTPPLNETLKFGWIQYLAFWLPLWFVLRQLKYFAAVFQITPCRVVVDRQQVRKISDHDF